MARTIKSADNHALEKQVLNIRIAVLEDRIRTHRMIVRDGWVPKWKEIPDANEYLWATLGDERADDSA